MDIAALGYQVDSSDFDTAIPKIDKMTAAALKADAAADKLAKNSTAVNTGVAKTGVAAAGATAQMTKFGGASANVFAQLNDIAVMMAAGQNPMQLAMQQGMQLNQTWLQLGNNIKSIGGAIGSAFMSMLNPINLVTIGVIAFGAAAVNWFMSAGGAAKSFKESIDGIDDVLASANEAANMLSVDGLEDLRTKYGQVTSEILNLTKASQQLELAKTIAAAREAIAGIKAELGDGVFNTSIGEMARVFETTDRYAGNVYAKLQNLSNLPIDKQVDVIAGMREQLAGVTNNFTDMTDEQLAMLGYLTTAEDRLRQLDYLSGKLKGSIEGATGSIWNFVAGSDAASGALAGAASWADALAVKATTAASAIWSALGAVAKQAQYATGVGAGRGASPGGKLIGGFSQVENSDPNGFRRELAAVEKLQTALKATGKAGGSGGGAGGKISKGMKEAEKATESADKAAKELQEQLDKPMLSAIEGMSSAWGDFVNRGFKDFKGFIQGVKDSFVQSIADMAAYAFKNKIMISMGLGGAGGVAGTAASASTGGGGLMGMLLGGGSGGGAGGLGGLIGAFSGGAGGVLGGLMNGGLGGALEGLTTALGGVSGGGLAGLAGAAGAIGAVVGGLGLIASFFKTKKTLLDGGFKITVKGMKSMVETFQTIEKKKFWGLSKKVSTNFEKAANSIANPIERVLFRIQKSVVKNAATIGVSADVFDRFRKSLKFSTKDMSKSEIQEELQRRLTGFGNAFAKMVPGLMEMRRAGEGAMAALARVAFQFKTVNKTWDVFGFNLYDVSVKGAKAADAIVKIFGNVQNFIQSTAFYFDNFYTDQEKIAELERQISGTMSKAGVGGAIPKTIEQYRALVDQLEASGNDKAAAKLIKLAPLFIQLQDALGGVTNEVNALKDALNPNDFATLFDYQLAGARLMSGASVPNGPSIYSAPASNVAASTSPAVTQSSGQASTPATNGAENNDALLVQILQQLRSLRNINFKWDTEGMPDIREA